MEHDAPMKNATFISPEGTILFPPEGLYSTQVIDFYGAADGVRTRDNWNHNPRCLLRSNPTKSRVSAFLGGRICKFFAPLYACKSVVVSVLFPREAVA
jgi:hypothetical protein